MRLLPKSFKIYNFIKKGAYLKFRSRGGTLIQLNTVLISRQCRVQYDKYFPSFSYFKLKSNMRNKENICYIARRCRAITILSLSQK